MMKTDNELIAEFMGYHIFEHDSFGTPVKCFSQIKEHSVERALDMRHVNLLKYDTSWDWLMPVVEKISKIVTPENEVINNGDESRFDSFYPRTFGMLNAETKQFMVRINRFPLYQSDSLIGATYGAVVDFIKWYNQTTN